MTRPSIFFLLSILIGTHSLGQKLGDYFVSITIDGTQGGRFKFISDTTIELSNVPRHMRPSLKTVYKYIKTDTTIQIFPEPVISQDNSQQGLYIQPFTLNTKTILVKIDRGFIDYSKSLIYVRQKDFGNNPDIAYIIDGKTFIQDVGETDGYGLIKKKPKTNKALQKKLKGLNKDNSTIEIVSGLNAYKRFGIKRAYGAVVITTKK